MKTKIIITVALLLAVTVLYGQNKKEPLAPRPKNNFNLNLLGNSSILSFNYERLFFIKPIFFISGELGIGYNITAYIFEPADEAVPDHLIIPHLITGNLGKGRHFCEFGLGGAIITGGSHNYILYPIIGYRLQPLRSKKVNLRLFASYPIYGKDVEESLDIIFSPIGLSFGICF